MAKLLFQEAYYHWTRHAYFFVLSHHISSRIISRDGWCEQKSCHLMPLQSLSHSSFSAEAMFPSTKLNTS